MFDQDLARRNGLIVLTDIIDASPIYISVASIAMIIGGPQRSNKAVVFFRDGGAVSGEESQDDVLKMIDEVRRWQDG